MLPNTDSPALWFEGKFTKYTELNKLVDNWVTKIENHKGPIGLALPKSPEFIACLLACIKLGKTFIPLDTNLPKRVQWIKSNVEFGTWISETGIEVKPNSWKGNGYIIFTSGTTGKPKGVYIEGFEGVKTVTKAQITILKLSKPKTAWFLSPGFDASLSDIFITLYSEGCLYIPTCSLSNPKKTIQFFNEHTITYADLPPRILTIFKPNQLKSLQNIIVGGEMLPLRAAKVWAGKVNVWNSYGPTEATISSSMCKVRLGWSKAWLGEPLQNITYKVKVGSELKDKITNKESGELYISGHLANGYYKERELTHKKFPIIEGNRYFKTGDIVGKGEHGLFFIGRSDRQVKINGVLISPEELEAAVTSEVYIDKYKGKLTAWTTGSIAAVKAELAAKFDRIFQPKKFISVQSIPRNQNGKINKIALCR